MEQRPAPHARRIFASRTLNLRGIRAIGYDMDYTLVHYRFGAWEGRAYAHLQQMLADEGWPVTDLRFDPDLVIRGLVVDAELGNIVKANRFGYVLRAAHGTRMLSYDEQRAIYRHVPVDLGSPRFQFLNTLFSLSESCLYAQLVDLYDQERFPGVHGYEDLFRRVRAGIDRTHVEGTLKAEIIDDPSEFVDLDPDAALALLDQHRAGKRLMLISNSEWPYARAMMSYAFDRYLPGDVTWRDLFELVIVQARKPDFFGARLPLFRIVDEDRGTLLPVPGRIPEPGLYLGGDAAKVEAYLRLAGGDILYVGDHVYADVRMSKSTLRWRTALVLRELEDEIEALDAFRSQEDSLAAMMSAKRELEATISTTRLELQRARLGYGPQPDAEVDGLEARLEAQRAEAMALDARIAPLAKAGSEVLNARWGPLLRAGNDKSHLARQLERSADIYTSRVSNFLHATPFAYLRSSRGSMPHDP